MFLKIFKANKQLLSSLQSCLHLNGNLMRLHFCLNHLAQHNKQYKMNVVLFIFQKVTRYTRILLQTFVRMQLISWNVDCDSRCFSKAHFIKKLRGQLCLLGVMYCVVTYFRILTSFQLYALIKVTE